MPGRKKGFSGKKGKEPVRIFFPKGRRPFWIEVLIDPRTEIAYRIIEGIFNGETVEQVRQNWQERLASRKERLKVFLKHKADDELVRRELELIAQGEAVASKFDRLFSKLQDTKGRNSFLKANLPRVIKRERKELLEEKEARLLSTDVNVNIGYVLSPTKGPSKREIKIAIDNAKFYEYLFKNRRLLVKNLGAKISAADRKFLNERVEFWQRVRETLQRIPQMTPGEKRWFREYYKKSITGLVF